MPDEEFKIIAKVRLVVENLDNLKKEISNVTKNVKVSTGDRFRAGVGGIASSITTAVNKLTGSIEKFISQIAKKFSALTNVDAMVENAIKRPLQNIFGGNIVSNIRKGLVKEGGNLIDELLGKGSEKAGEEGMEGMVGGRKGGGVKGGGGAMAALLAIFIVVAILEKIFGLIKKIVNYLIDSSPILKSVVDMFKLALQLFFMPFGNIIGILLRPLAITLIKFAVWWIKLFRPFEKFLMNLTKNPIDTVVGTMREIWNDIMNLFSSMSAMTTTAIVNAISTLSTSLINAMMQLPAMFGNAVANAFTTAVRGSISSVQNIASGGSLLNITGW